MVARFKEQPLLNGALGALCVAVIVAAVLAVGPSSSSGGQSTRTATVQHGVVQSTVSGSGNVEPSSQLNLGFKAAGTVTSIYVSQGQHVAKGQLIATLDPHSAEVALEQSKASLQSAQADLAKLEETGGETSSGSEAKSSPSAGSGTAAKSTPASGSSSAQSQPASTTSTTESAAVKEANLAAARASVKSAELTVESDETALHDTGLYAPQSGTIVSLSGEVGETVSATGTTRSSQSGSTGSSGSGAGGGGGANAASGGASTTSSSSSSASQSSSAFAVLSDLESMHLVVPLSESEISEVKPGQIATVTIEALSGRKVSAHVTSVDELPTSSSGAVSYDVTFQLDQGAEGLKTGMSATAEVVVKQEEGLSVPSSAVSSGTVTVIRGGQHVTQAVTTGLTGNSSTVILSGLGAGEQVVLPTPTVSAGGSTLRSRLGGALGGGGFGGGGGGGFAGGGFAVRGGG